MQPKVGTTPQRQCPIWIYNICSQRWALHHRNNVQFENKYAPIGRCYAMQTGSDLMKAMLVRVTIKARDSVWFEKYRGKYAYWLDKRVSSNWGVCVPLMSVWYCSDISRPFWFALQLLKKHMMLESLVSKHFVGTHGKLLIDNEDLFILNLFARAELWEEWWRWVLDSVGFVCPFGWVSEDASK